MSAPAYNAHAPTGAIIIGSFETMSGRSNITAFERNVDGTMAPIFEGTTETFDQVQQERDGELLWVDEAGDIWRTSELTFTVAGEAT